MIPARQVKRRLEGDRLAYYVVTADATFWDRHWQQELRPESFNVAAQGGGLGRFKQPFRRYLPREGRVLEAGCGLGLHVIALRALGYDAEGVEWAEETVKAVQGFCPGVPIRVGDVTKLEVPDGSYRGYISLGVVEHQKDGPEPFLREACRVLAPEGVAFVSVPFVNPLRRAKARLGRYRDKVDGLQFYQYAFTEAEFTALLQHSGFQIVTRSFYGGFKGIKDEIPTIRQIAQRGFIGQWIQRRIETASWAKRNVGHMILFVCRKPG